MNKMSKPNRKKSQKEDRKNKIEGFEDNRHNLNKIKGDKALDEIDFYIVKYIYLESKFNKKKTISNNVSIYSLSVLLVCMSLIYSQVIFDENVLSELCRTGVNYIFSVAFITFIVNYFLSRMKGYTRAWSRSRLMLERLEIIRREHELALNGNDDADEKDKKSLLIEQANTLTKLFDLEAKNRIETHKDIVGDYLAAHEGTFSWIKGLRK